MRPFGTQFQIYSHSVAEGIKLVGQIKSEIGHFVYDSQLGGNKPMLLAFTDQIKDSIIHIREENG